jgi:hypothetical protein
MSADAFCRSSRPLTSSSGQQRVPGLNEVLIQHDYDIGGDRGQRLAALSADQPRPPLNRGALPKIALLALIWGSAFLWIKLADRGFSAVEVTLSRLALGAAVLFVVMLARRDKVPRSPRLWATIVIAALFANAVPYLLFAVAEQSVASSTAGIINATTPLWTLIVALAVRHQQSATRWQTAGLVVGFAGAVLIFTPWKTACEPRRHRPGPDRGGPDAPPKTSRWASTGHLEYHKPQRHQRRSPRP